MPMLSEWFSGVRVHIETREIAARDIYTNPVPFLEPIRGGEGLDRQLVHLAWSHQDLPLRGLAIARAQDAVGEVHLESRRVVLRRWVDVHELDGEIGIDGAR